MGRQLAHARILACNDKNNVNDHDVNILSV